jgi:hypothetical protein
MITMLMAATLLAGSVAAEPEKWACAEPKWEGTPGLRPNSDFEGKMTVDCEIQLDAAGSVVFLDAYFLDEVAKARM